jgi:hypothetical protein
LGASRWNNANVNKISEIRCGRFVDKRRFN